MNGGLILHIKRFHPLVVYYPLSYLLRIVCVYVCGSVYRNVYDKPFLIHTTRTKRNVYFRRGIFCVSAACRKWLQEMKKEHINTKMAKKRNKFNWKFAQVCSHYRVYTCTEFCCYHYLFFHLISPHVIILAYACSFETYNHLCVLLLTHSLTYSPTEWFDSEVIRLATLFAIFRISLKKWNTRENKKRISIFHSPFLRNMFILRKWQLALLRLIEILYAYVLLTFVSTVLLIYFLLVFSSVHRKLNDINSGGSDGFNIAHFISRKCFFSSFFFLFRRMSFANFKSSIWIFDFNKQYLVGCVVQCVLCTSPYTFFSIIHFVSMCYSKEKQPGMPFFIMRLFEWKNSNSCFWKSKQAKIGLSFRDSF